MSLITAAGLRKSFGPVDIFSNISLSIPHRSRIAIVGPNGIGKTTLLRILAGEDTPSAGHVSSARNLRTGYLPQEASVFRGLNVEQNIMAALEVVEPSTMVVLKPDGKGSFRVIQVIRVQEWNQKRSR